MKVDWNTFVRENLLEWSLWLKTTSKSSFENFQKQLPLRGIDVKHVKQSIKFTAIAII